MATAIETARTQVDAGSTGADERDPAERDDASKIDEILELVRTQRRNDMSKTSRETLRLLSVVGGALSEGEPFKVAISPDHVQPSGTRLGLA